MKMGLLSTELFLGRHSCFIKGEEYSSSTKEPLDGLLTMSLGSNNAIMMVNKFIG